MPGADARPEDAQAEFDEVRFERLWKRPRKVQPGSA
jgi:hypothetical protein